MDIICPPPWECNIDGEFIAYSYGNILVTWDSQEQTGYLQIGDESAIHFPPGALQDVIPHGDGSIDIKHPVAVVYDDMGMPWPAIENDWTKIYQDGSVESLGGGGGAGGQPVSLEEAFGGLPQNPYGWGDEMANARDSFGDADEDLVAPRRDPLILDLNGDGIKTTNLKGGSFFDHNRDGFAELTGWVDPNDGLLVMDRNGDGIINDGTELFGDQTFLRNGARAGNGFQALAELNTTYDGKIDAQDEAFSQLRVWQDLNGDGISSPNELHTLAELGITSISLNSTITDATDAQGNTQNRLGSFERMDGSIGQIANYNLQRDPMYTIPEEWLDVPDDIAALPDLCGYGTVHDLHQAMVRDSSGELKSLVEQFATTNDENARGTLMDKILLKWTGTKREDLSFRLDLQFGNYDGCKIMVLEKFFGEQFKIMKKLPDGATLEYTPPPPPSDVRYIGIAIKPPPPKLTDESVARLNESYRLVSEWMYAGLMAQTHLKSLYEKITYTWDEQKHEIKRDMSGVITELQTDLGNNPEQGKELLSEFARSMRGYSAQGTVTYLSFREAFIQQDPELGWVIDSGGLPVIEPSQGFRHTLGTDNADAIRGSLTEGDGCLNSEYGNDVIYGTDRDEILFNEDGDAVLVAGGGYDQIFAGAGNDILDGGAGNDWLYGEAGNDTYIFRRGSGHDVIIDYDATPGNTDSIFLGSNLTPDDIFLRRVGNDLVLKINDTADTLKVQNYFKDDSPLNKIERILFMNGTVWGESEIFAATIAPTEGDDIIYGRGTNDTLRGAGGNDTLYGKGGDDVLRGDAGNDVLDGGSGNDTYVFGRGSGQDTIMTQTATAQDTDTIALGDGILPADIKLQRIWNDLKLTIVDSQDTITVRDWIVADTPGHGLSSIKFADGTEWGTDVIQEMLLQSTDGDDNILGFAKSDTIAGAGGNDVISGRGGDDILDGGAGNDTLHGEAGNDTLNGGTGTDTLLGGTGNDTYLFGRGSGQDTILDVDKTAGNLDTIRLADDLTPADITLQRQGDSLELTISGTADKLTVQNWFWNDSYEYRVERIQFSDGTIWDVDAIKLMALEGTSGDDTLLGYATSDTIRGYDGNDTLIGRGGDDTLDLCFNRTRRLSGC